MFSEKRIIRVSPGEIGRIAAEVKEDLETSGYKVTAGSGIAGDAVLTVNKGGFFAMMFWLKRDAKVSLSAQGDKVVCDVQDSFFLVNLIALGPTWFLFPIPIITFIIGMVKQKGLKARIFESVNAAALRSGSAPKAEEKRCAQCGALVSGPFCTKCGAKQ